MIRTNDLGRVPDDGSLEILGVDNAMFAVGDYELALEFYGGRLGLPLKFELAPRGIAGFRLGPEEPGLFIHVRSLVPEGPRETPRLWLEVRDARAAAAQLLSRGVVPLEEPCEVATG